MKNTPILKAQGDPKMSPFSDPKMIFSLVLLFSFLFFLAGFFIGKRFPINPQPKPNPVIQTIK
jgi:hypothetical protein